MDVEAGSGVAAPDECDCKGTRKLPKEMLARTSPMDPEDADMLDGFLMMYTACPCLNIAVRKGLGSISAAIESSATYLAISCNGKST
jgi:hypothetical protein